MIKIILTTSLIASAGFVSATTMITPGEYNTGTNWDTGLPSVGNDGTINVTATTTLLSLDGDFSVTIGTLGSLTDIGTGDTVVKGEASIILDGGSLTLSNPRFRDGGSNSGGNVVMKSGSFTATGADIRLISTGTWLQFAAGGSGTVVFDEVFDTWATTSEILDFETGNTGTFTVNNGTLAAYTTRFEGGAIRVNGADVSAGLITDYFDVSADGKTISLAAVPEPSSAALLGLGGIALILRRRK